MTVISNWFTRDEIKPARELANLSQRELAALSGVSQGRIAGLESRTVPVAVIEALNKALADRLGGGA